MMILTTIAPEAHQVKIDQTFIPRPAGVSPVNWVLFWKAVQVLNRKAESMDGDDLLTWAQKAHVPGGRF